MPDLRDPGGDPWGPNTTCREALLYCTERLPEFLVLFEAAYRKQDNAHMIENVVLMRRVVTRLDAFRRMKVRQWAAADAAILKTRVKTE